MSGESDEVFGELLERWRGRLFAAAYAESGRYDEAQDAVAEAAVRIFRHRGRLRDPERFGAWACTIARREARRLIARRDTVCDDAAQCAIATDPDTALRLDVRAALRRLTAEQAAVVQLFYFDGQEVAAIAARLRIAEGTVKWRLSRSRSRLRTELEGYEPMESIADETALCALVATQMEPARRQGCVEALKRAGWKDVRVIARFDEAAGLDSRFLCVVIDETIEGRSAFELIPLLRAQPERRLFLLADRDRPEGGALEHTVRAAYMAGVDMLLTKPFDTSEFENFARRLRTASEK